MKQILRPLSPRPEFIVDEHGQVLGDPTDNSTVGVDAPFGRERCVSALPLGGVGAQHYAKATLLRDHDSCSVADPDSFVLGKPGLWISRLLNARWVEDTRRL